MIASNNPTHKDIINHGAYVTINSINKKIPATIATIPNININRVIVLFILTEFYLLSIPHHPIPYRRHNVLRCCRFVLSHPFAYWLLHHIPKLLYKHSSFLHPLA